MSRRFLLVGALVVVKQGSMEQLAYGTVISIIYLTLQTVAAPFRKRSDEFFAAACSFLLVTLFVCCGIYKYGSLLQLADVQAKLSPEQKTDYLMSHVSLSSIILATSVGALVALGMILAALAGGDVVQHYQEMRAGLARRLRYTKTDQDVVPPPIPEWRQDAPPASAPWLPKRSQCPFNQVGAFHLFLSHNWAQVCAKCEPVTMSASAALQTVCDCAALCAFIFAGPGSDENHEDAAARDDSGAVHLSGR